MLSPESSQALSDFQVRRPVSFSILSILRYVKYIIAEIWKTLLLLMFCEILTKEIETRFYGNSRAIVKNIKKAIDEFYDNAFSPEIISALNFIEHSDAAAKILAKYAEVGSSSSATKEYSAKQFQTNLLYIRKKFESVISSAHLEQDFLMFIDGIDIRPSGIEFEDYLDCIKGLANAVWFLNNDFFSGIRAIVYLFGQGRI